MHTTLFNDFLLMMHLIHRWLNEQEEALGQMQIRLHLSHTFCVDRMEKGKKKKGITEKKAGKQEEEGGIARRVF
jgi:hypothetical protein